MNVHLTLAIQPNEGIASGWWEPVVPLTSPISREAHLDTRIVGGRPSHEDQPDRWRDSDKSEPHDPLKCHEA